MLMLVSVTPGSVAPLASPGPHTAFSVPKSPTPAAAAVVAVVPPAGAVVAVALDDPDRLQPDATSTPMIDTPTARLIPRPRMCICHSPLIFVRTCHASVRGLGL